MNRAAFGRLISRACALGRDDTRRHGTLVRHTHRCDSPRHRSNRRGSGAASESSGGVVGVRHGAPLKVTCHSNSLLRGEKQMRSGPATRTALFSRILFAPFHARGMGESSLLHLHSGESGRMMLLGRLSSRSRLRNSTCGTTVVPAASPAVCGGLLRRPQRPGNQCAPRRASGGTLPTIHPRELSGTAGSAAMLWQGMQESRLNVDTVRYRWLAIKRKPEHCCAETVNVRTSLWKATENQTTISTACLALTRTFGSAGNSRAERQFQFLRTVIDAVRELARRIIWKEEIADQRVLTYSVRTTS